MAQPLTSTIIEALIEGGVSGQVAVGNQNVQIHADHGAVVFLTPPGTQPAPRLRALPILQRPRPVRGLVDRQSDISTALAAIGTALPVGIHGAPGIGKSTLLRHLAYVVESRTLADGVIHLSAHQQPAEDLLQSLFDAFYACDVPFKPTTVQARQLLQSRRALVLLDDAELGREAVEVLLDSAPDCAFVLSMRERCLWGESRAIGLGGLPPEDARALFERELGRSLTAEEAPAFESLYARLNGHPLHLLQAAAEVREGRPIAEPALIDEGSGRQALAAIPEDQRRVLSALAAVGGGPVGAAHISVLADVANPLPALDALLERKLVQSHSPRYSLTGNLPDLLPKALDLTPWRERALGYFIDWAEAHHNEPAVLLEEAGVLRHLLDWAAETGRHAEARRLGRALDTALTVAGGWGAWEQSLDRVRGAAEALGDRATEGWALHQLGTRLLCLDDKAAARPLLLDALAIREALGDRAGAAVTRHNLGLLGPPPSEPSRGGKGSRPPLRLLPWIGGAVLVLVVGGIWLLLPPSLDESKGFEVPQSVEFPTVELGSPSDSQEKAIFVSNTGTIPLRVAGVSFTENPGQAFALRSGCLRSPVLAGAHCSIQVVFRPPEAGSYRAVLAVEAEGLEQRTVEISGAATEPPRPAMTLSPAALDFETVRVGESRPLEVTITSSGNAPLRIDDISFTENSDQAFILNSGCVRNLLPAEPPCSIQVVFRPPKAGSYSAVLAVEAEGLERQPVEILGAATEPPRPAMTLSPAAGLDFEKLSVGESRPLEVTITSSGNAPLRIDDISFTSFTENSDQAFTLSSGCMRSPLPAGTRCIIQVLFRPPKAGSYRAVLAIAVERLGRRLVKISGTAIEKPAITLSPLESPPGGVPVDLSPQSVERMQTDMTHNIPLTVTTGCCVDGTFKEGMAAEECARRRGVAMTTAEAVRCQKPGETTPPPPQKGFCCIRPIGE